MLMAGRMTFQKRKCFQHYSRSIWKGSPHEELERPCSEFPIEWDAPQTAPRVAKIYLLGLIPYQVWEVRYRSESPGRPLVLAIATSDFPDSELLSWCDTTYGIQEEYYLAVNNQVGG